MVMLLLACADAPVQDSALFEPVALPPTLALSRVALDVAGRRPTEDELLRVEADPDALPEVLEVYLHEPGFEQRIVEAYNRVFLTRSDFFDVGVDGDAGFVTSEAEYAEFTRSMGEEPLRMLAWVASQDLPYTELVTADYTVANDVMLRHLPLEAIDEGEGWRRARYTDNRPAAGLLAGTGLYWRYTTTPENRNRRRAEIILRSMVCDTRFDQPIEFTASTDVASRDEFQERTQTDPGCLTCHVVLDPVASYLWGYYRFHIASYTEASYYYGTREDYWDDGVAPPPGWYGQPGQGLADLGTSIAADPRFPACAVEQAFTNAFERAPGDQDLQRLARHREAFLRGDLLLRELYRSVALDPAYLSIDDRWDEAVPLKRVSPELMASQLEALTGFRWTYEGWDMLTSDKYGVRVLAGGMDGMIVTLPAPDHSVTEAMVWQRAAEAAASYAVEQESAQPPQDRRLFREVDALTEPLDADQAAAQIQALVFRAHGRRAELDAPQVQGLVGLWSQLVTAGLEPDQAWVAVLSALFRDPDFVHY
jgi:hypothetical protein